MIKNIFSFSDQMLKGFARNTSPEALHQKLDAMAGLMGKADFKKQVARQIVERTHPQSAIPDIYCHYKDLVGDGIEFFLSEVSFKRLADVVVSQLKMDPDAGTQERLLELAKQFPTLHKLGQIIARNPNIDPEVKKWLIHLENGCYGTPPGGLLDGIHGELKHIGHQGEIHVQPAILSEASVGAVIPFEWEQDQMCRGVFKILKPDIKKHLDEELSILEKTARFFEKHRDRYALKNFRFLEIFQDVREMLVKEIDLVAEQAHLNEAASFYAGMDNIRIPQLLPFATDHMTAMEYLNGPKITDADFNSRQREHCATVLFEALVCRPLFSTHEPALFHGDPHAGNILAVMDSDSKACQVGLLDWSLAGWLPKSERIKTVQLIQAILKQDLSGICNCVIALSDMDSNADTNSRQQLRILVLELIRSPELSRLNLVKKSFRLLEELSYEGHVFPAALMLFRKAVFTLEGVIHDLWPSFDMDDSVMKYLKALMSQEIPMRFSSLFFPLTDRPEKYPSLISNMELNSLMAHQYIAAIKSSYEMMSKSFMSLGRIFGMPYQPVLSPVPLSRNKDK